MTSHKRVLDLIQKHWDIRRTMCSSREWLYGDVPRSHPDWVSIREMWMMEELEIAQYIGSHSKADLKRQIGDRRYFVTFTKDPKKGHTTEEWKKAVLKQIQRKTFTNYCYCYEHQDTNLHCHAVLSTPHTINATNFASFAKNYGIVLIPKHEVIDNGLERYMTKENPIVFKDPKNKNIATTQHGVQEDLPQEDLSSEEEDNSLEECQSILNGYFGPEGVCTEETQE